MADDKSGARELVSYSFSVVFANDKLIDADELAMLERIALRDGKLDDGEREVLRNIFARAEGRPIAPEVREEIHRFREVYGV